MLENLINNLDYNSLIKFFANLETEITKDEIIGLIRDMYKVIDEAPFDNTNGKYIDVDVDGLIHLAGNYENGKLVDLEVYIKIYSVIVNDEQYNEQPHVSL